MRTRQILLDSTHKAQPENGNEDFPLEIYEQHSGIVGECCARHWHEELQFSLVTKGAVCFKTPQGSYRVNKGGGIFFNGGTMHEAVAEQDGSCYVCVNFLPSMLYGSETSRIKKRYVDPLLSCERNMTVPLGRDGWGHELLTGLQELVDVCETAAHGYELDVKARLLKIWLALYHGVERPRNREVTVSYSDKCRIEALNQYIAEHYMQRITLDDIASAVHISRGECCRIFKRLYTISPHQYLMQYRLSQSRRLLADTDTSIADIALQLGFGSSSHFTECFKKEYHCTPLKYRKKFYRVSRQSADEGAAELDPAVFGFAIHPSVPMV